MAHAHVAGRYVTATPSQSAATQPSSCSVSILGGAIVADDAG